MGYQLAYELEWAVKQNPGLDTWLRATLGFQHLLIAAHVDQPVVDYNILQSSTETNIPTATRTTYADGSTVVASWVADARGAPSLVVSNNHTVAPKGFHFEGAGAGAASLMSGGAYTSYHGPPLSLSSVSEHLIVEDDAQLASPGNGSVRLWHLRGEETPISVDLSKA